MTSFVPTLALLAWLSVPCSGLPGVTRPTVTEAGPHTPAWSPEPTPAAVIKQERDVGGNATCGFVGGVYASPLTCENASHTCVVDDKAMVLGCCEMTSVGQSSSYFADCGFYTSCIDYGEYPNTPATGVSGSVAANAGVLTCSPASPSCAKYQLSHDDLTYSFLGCASTSGQPSLQQTLPYLPTYTQLPETVSPSLTNSSPASLTPTPSPQAKTNRKKLAKIIAPSVVGPLILISLAVYMFHIRVYPDLKPTLGTPENRPNIDPIPLADTFYHLKNHLLFFPPRFGLSVQGWKSRHLTMVSKESQFLTFLSSYGVDGVSLCELVMLGTLRQSGGKSKNHWLKNGEVGSLQEAMPETSGKGRDQPSFLDDFMEAVRDRRNIEHFQTRLEDLGLIDVRYPKGSPFDESYTSLDALDVEVASEYWYTDRRIWSIRGDKWPGASQPISAPILVRELLGVFMEMPEKDVSPAAQRQREFYCCHARLLVRRIRLSGTNFGEDRTVLLEAAFVILQVLTHRYEEGDAPLFRFLEKNTVRLSSLPIDIMLLWAKLKESASRQDSHGLFKIQGRLLDLINSDRRSFDSTPLENGLLGFLLVDLMNTAKAAGFPDIVSNAVRAGTKWVDRKSTPKSTLERTAVCEALAAFNIHDWKEEIPHKYHLFYGYHLSRVGLLVQGDRLLASGLKRHKGSLRLWSHEFERISIALRLGRWNDAAQMLDSLKRLARHNRDEGGHLNLWKRSGECGEVFVLLALYEADCYASSGDLEDACAKLITGISIIPPMYDYYIQTLRVTLKTRLLELHMWQQNLDKALPVALDLASSVCDHRTYSIFAPDTTYGIVLQIINLSNNLLSRGDAADSLRLLEKISRIRAPLPDEILLYVKQRMAIARRLCEAKKLEHDSITSEKEETTAPTIATQDKLVEPKSSKPEISEPRQLPRLARESRGRKSKAFHFYSSNLNRILKAPLPPKTQPNTSVAKSREKAFQREEDPPQVELGPILTETT